MNLCMSTHPQTQYKVSQPIYKSPWIHSPSKKVLHCDNNSDAYGSTLYVVAVPRAFLHLMCPETTFHISLILSFVSFNEYMTYSLIPLATSEEYFLLTHSRIKKYTFCQ
jgi:hypothetical protein